MTFFEKADKIDAAVLANAYAGQIAKLLRENTILSIQIQQHVDREKELIKIIKKTAPNVYQGLKKAGDDNGR